MISVTTTTTIIIGATDSSSSNSQCQTCNTTCNVTRGPSTLKYDNDCPFYSSYNEFTALEPEEKDLFEEEEKQVFPIHKTRVKASVKPNPKIIRQMAFMCCLSRRGI